MNITNDLSVGRQIQQINANTAANTDKAAVAAKPTKDDSAVAVNISHKSIKTDVAYENILAASSGLDDISKAEEMIRNANLNILNNSSDAIMTQSKQSASVAMELLK